MKDLVLGQRVALDPRGGVGALAQEDLVELVGEAGLKWSSGDVPALGEHLAEQHPCPVVELLSRIEVERDPRVCVGVLSAHVSNSKGVISPGEMV